jgi:hypothetical protein
LTGAASKAVDLGGERPLWVANGGELIKLPADEQATMLGILASVGEDVSKAKPALHEAYQEVLAAAQRARRSHSQ